MAGHVVRLAPVTVLMLLGTMGAGAGVGSCGDAKCSADCGPVSHMFDDDADDSTERSQADAGGCGWDSSTASCRKGFFTVASEAAALIEAVPGACDRHRAGDGLGPVSSEAKRKNKANPTKKQKQKQSMPPTLPSPPPSEENPDGINLDDDDDDDDDRGGGGGGSSVVAMATEPATPTPLPTAPPTAPEQKKIAPTTAPANVAEAPGSVGGPGGDVTAVMGGSGAGGVPENAMDGTMDVLAQYENIAEESEDTDILVQFQFAVAREDKAKAASAQLGPNPVQSEQSDHVTALQLFHLSLLKGSRAPPWKTAKASKNKKKNKNTRREMPKSVVAEFRKRYKSTAYMATIFPAEADDTVDAVMPTPQPCRDAAASVTTAAILSALVRRNKMRRTVEIGFACGCSGTTLAMAHRELAKKPGSSSEHKHKHFAIDPAAAEGSKGLQKTGFGGFGQAVIEKLGLGDHFELRQLPSHDALPGLLKEFGAGSFDLVFIDGMHLFDFVMMEVYFADLLLNVGGFLVFDDALMPAVQQAVLYVVHNRHYSLVPSVHLEARSVVLKKTAVDDREWFDHHAF